MSAVRRSTSRLLAFVLAAVSFGTAGAFEEGPPPANTGGFGETDCSSCHFDNALNAAEGTLALTGVPEFFVPGQRYALTVSLDHPQLVVAGFQLSVRTADGKPAGELAVTGNDVGTVVPGNTGITYAQHKRPRHKSDGGIRWVVTWRAPDEDVAVIVNVAANAANYDVSAFGDHIFTTSVGTAASKESAASLRSEGDTDTEGASEECDPGSQD